MVPTKVRSPQLVPRSTCICGIIPLIISRQCVGAMLLEHPALETVITDFGINVFTLQNEPFSPSQWKDLWSTSLLGIYVK